MAVSYDLLQAPSGADRQRPAAHPLSPAVHPLGSHAKILLASVFGPYAQDDDYGSRAMNPMELYHNQVTREQGPFSLRMFHRSWGLMLIQANVRAPCTLLDFPSLDRFIEELRSNEYDIVGIGSIPVNVFKVRAMCELVRHYQPRATIVIGGHIANMRDLDEQIDADFIVKGEGVAGFAASWAKTWAPQDAADFPWLNLATVFAYVGGSVTSYIVYANWVGMRGWGLAGHPQIEQIR